MKNTKQIKQILQNITNAFNKLDLKSRTSEFSKAARDLTKEWIKLKKIVIFDDLSNNDFIKREFDDDFFEFASPLKNQQANEFKTTVRNVINK
ncbi:hypothetical protein, partial [Mycoplasmopsis pullorum]